MNQQKRDREYWTNLIINLHNKVQDLENRLVKLENYVKIHKKDIISESKAKFTIPNDELESIYKRYPRKLGKQAGMTKIKREIKSSGELALFKIAVDNYALYHKLKKTEQDYIHHFSTWVNSHWRDWIKPDNEIMPNHADTAHREKVRQDYQKVQQENIKRRENNKDVRNPQKLKQILENMGVKNLNEAIKQKL